MDEKAVLSKEEIIADLKEFYNKVINDKVTNCFEEYIDFLKTIISEYEENNEDNDVKIIANTIVITRRIAEITTINDCSEIIEHKKHDYIY